MKLTTINNVSVDGYTEDEHGSFEWTAPDDEVFAFITNLVRSVGTFLNGRRMYETMAVWETEPGLAAQSSSGSSSPRSGRRRRRLSTPRPWRPYRPPGLGSSAASTPARSAT